MESYMIWHLSMCVGFLLALVAVILIVVTVMIVGHFLRKIDTDITKELLDCERYREVIRDDRDE